MYNKFYGIKEEPKEVKVEVLDTASHKSKNDEESSLFEKLKEKKNQPEVTKNNKDSKQQTDVVNKKEIKKEKTEVVQKKAKDNKTNSEYETYTVKSGDFLSKIAEDYGVSVSDLKEWNNITGEKILVGQKLRIYSAEDAADKKQKKDKNTKTKPTTHTVQEGENLTLIADKYDVSVEDLKDWNDLDGDVIIPGQKLTVVEPKQQKKSKDTKVIKKAKTHIVKEGENLTMIAEKYDLTVKQLKDWNELDGDVIQAGDELVLTAPKDVKKKVVEKQEVQKTYKVKKGDNLQIIADKFDVTVKELKLWNELDDNTILVGQELKVTAPKKKKK